ncbi:hypothetical protein BJV78DRAFT_1156512 [Lactifluus subvellereus]|nr:hypothetical protein BJV78DRAFT_1156512 [Lactifluus subvellereus]
MCAKMAEEEDSKMVNAGNLFSAAVATLVAVSVQDIVQTSQNSPRSILRTFISSFADPIAPHAPILSTLVKPPPFSPSRSAVWVNSLVLGHDYRSSLCSASIIATIVGTAICQDHSATMVQST